MATGTPLGRMVVELGLDDTSFAKGVEGAKKQISYFSKEMQANMRIADMAGDKLGVYSAKHEGLTKIIKAEEQRVAALTKAFETSKDENGKLTNQSIRYANQLEQARGNLARYNKQLAINAGEAAKWRIENEGFTGALNKTGKVMSDVGEKGLRLGKTLTVGVTTPIVAGVGLVTKAAMSWESAFAGVKKTNDEVVDSSGRVVYSYKDLENGLRGLAKELPATHEEIASVAEAAGQLGIKSENVVGFTKTMIDLGESTNMSAEVAATSLARLANITKMPQTEFDRLGSSITELGNNFATTESEIVEMSLRLAGAGKQVGMSEADILGLAAALSSVGIEAEMGGSAISKTLVNMQVAAATGLTKVKELEQATGMSRRELELMSSNNSKGFKELADSLGMTTTEMNKVVKAGKNLEGFAAIAGMTGEQFKKAFEQDAVGALGKFIDGLATAEDKGTTAIELLDEMGISEVRLRDSLLRAGNASELFTNAIQSSNEAWNENTALTEEANKRYETLESQLGMARNEIKDVAIELGGPLVRAFRDGLQASKPMLKTLSELATKFSEADPKTQQMVMKMIAYTAAAGPVIGVTSKITKGIGDMTQWTIKFLGSIVGKNTTSSFLKQITGGAKSIDAWKLATQGATQASKAFGPQVATSATDLTKFGSAATASSGFIAKATTSIGGFTGALGFLTSPLGLTIAALGVTGVAAWKLWGEEAWNSAQRTRQWGTDVGAVTHEALTKIKDDANAATGQFGLMASGLEVNTSSMVANFERVGQTIENSLTKRIEGLDKMLQQLPENFDEKTKKIIENEKTKNEEALKVVQENTARISEIKANAAKNDRALSVNEAKIIQDLARGTTEAYVKTLDVSAKEKQKILKAMTGDVEKASKEEAKLWLQSLGEQRRAAQEHAQKSRSEQEKYLKDMGYNLEGEFAKKYLKAWDEVNKTTVDGFDQQMATILQKYPELMNQVSLSNGQLINASSEYGKVMIQQNQKIVDNAKIMADQLSSNATKNAKALKWTVEEGKQYTSTWNGLVLDPKTGEVKSNAREVVIEAAKDTQKWNEIRMVVHDANLDSNAKKIIGEAAIANGYWQGMAWEDKEAVLQDKFSITMYKALEKSGDWNNLTLEQKTAFLYSNTPEVMTQTLFDLGMWDKYQPQIKDLKATNYDFFEKVSSSKELLNEYNSIPPDFKTLLATSPASLTVSDSKKILEQYNNLSPTMKNLLANNSVLVNNVTSAENKLNAYARNNPGPKHLHATADYSQVTAAKNAINSIPDVTTKWIQLQQRGAANPALYGPGFKKGTNFLNQSGPIMVNDQKGPLYKEIVHQPGETPRIYEGRNVIIPHAKRGTKVYKAVDTKRIMLQAGIPRFAEGTGVSPNAEIVKTMRRLNEDARNIQNKIVVQGGGSDNFETNRKLDVLISIMSQFGNDLRNLKLEANTKELASVVDAEQKYRSTMIAKAKGVRS